MPLTGAELQIYLTLKDKATKDLQTFQGKFTGSIKTMGASVKNFVAQHKLMIAAIVAGAGYMVKQGVSGAFEYGAEIAKLTQQTGLSTDAIQKLRYAAQQNKLEFESLAKLFPILSQNMLKAKDNQKEYEKGFGRIGISVTDSEGRLKSSYDVMLEMADFMNKSGVSAEEKMAMAKQLLGKSAADAIPFLQLGREEIEKMGDALERTGGLMSVETIAGMELFSDKMKEIEASVRGVWGSIVEGMLPNLNAIAEWAQNNMPILQEMAEEWGKTFGKTLNWILKIVLGIQGAFKLVAATYAKFFGLILSGQQKVAEIMAKISIVPSQRKFYQEMAEGIKESADSFHGAAMDMYNDALDYGVAIEDLGNTTEKYMSELAGKLLQITPKRPTVGLPDIEGGEEKPGKAEKGRTALDILKENLKLRTKYIDEFTLYQKRALIEQLKAEMERLQYGSEEWQLYFDNIKALQEASRTGWQAYWEDLTTYWRDWGQTIEDYMGGLMQTLEGGFSSFFNNILEGQKDFMDILVEFFNTMKSAFFKIIAEMLAKWVMANIMQKLLRVKTVAQEISGQIAIAIAKSYAAYAGIPWGGLAMGASAAAAQIAAITAATAPFVAGSAEKGAVIGGTRPINVRAHPNEAFLPLEKLPSLIPKIVMPQPAYAGAGGNFTLNIYGDIKTKADEEELFPMLERFYKKVIRGS